MAAALIGSSAGAPIRVAENGNRLPISGNAIGEFLADPNISEAVKHQTMETIAPRPMTDATGNVYISNQNQAPRGGPIFQGGIRGSDAAPAVPSFVTGSPANPRNVIVAPSVAGQGAPAASAPANPPTAGAQPPSAVPNIQGPGSVVGDLAAQRAAQEAANTQTKMAAEDYTKQYLDAQRDEIAAQQAGYPLHQIQSVMAAHGGNLPTGKGAEDILNAQSMANMISTWLGHPLTSEESTQTGLELLRKYGGQVSQAIAQRLGVHSNMGLESSQETSPGINIGSSSNEHLVDNLVRLNDLAQKYAHDKQSYYNAHGKSLDGFNDAWKQSISGANAIPLSKFGRSVTLKNGQKGVYVPSTDPSGFSLFPANAPELQ
jgi:hypothetical protein